MSSVSATEDFSSFWEFTSQGTSVSERLTDDVTCDDFGIRENRVKKLHHFAKNGNAKKLKKLLKIGVSPDDKSDSEKNCQGLSALHLAVRHNHLECVKLLLESGANVNITDNFGFRPIHDACLYGHLEILKLLLKHGAQTDGVDRQELSSIDPFFYAAQQHHIDCLQLLLPNRNNCDKVLWDLSSKRGSTELLDFISNKEIPVEMLQEWLRNSALTGQAGFFSRAKQILKRDLNENEAKSALLTAVQHGRASYVRVLLENHVDPNLSDDNKVTALHFAARYGQCNCIEELVKGGADINVVNLENWTPLHIAIKQCQEGAVKKLIELGCDINAAGGPYDERPLHLAAAVGDVQILRTLLRANPDMSAVNKFGKHVLEFNLNTEIREIITKQQSK